MSFFSSPSPSSSRCWILVLVAALALLHRADAVEFLVGGSAGWTLPSFGHVNYTQWTLGNRYHVGDRLVFNYSKDFHNVMMVNKADFIACSTANPKATFQDGHTVINLTSPGPLFFVCGVPGHCGQGQKLLVVVRARPAGHHAVSPSQSPLPAGQQSIPAVQNPHIGPAHAPMAAAATTAAVQAAWAVLVTAAAVAALVPL